MLKNGLTNIVGSLDKLQRYVSKDNIKSVVKEFIGNQFTKSDSEVYTDIKLAGDDEPLTVSEVRGFAMGLEKTNPEKARLLYAYADNVYKERRETAISSAWKASAKEDHKKVFEEDDKYTTGLLDWISDKTADNKEFQENMQKEIQANIDKAKNPFGRKLAELTPSVGDNAVGISLKFINPVLGNSAFLLSAGNEYYKDGLARGMTDDQAFWYGIAGGIIEGGSESVISGQTVSNGMKLITGKGLSSKFLKGSVVNYAENFVQEALTEPASEFAVETIAGKEFSDWSNMKQRMMNSGFDGFLTALIYTGAGVGIGSAKQIVQNSKATTQQKIQAANDVINSGKVDVDGIKQIAVQATKEKIANEIKKVEERSSKQNLVDVINENVDNTVDNTSYLGYNNTERDGGASGEQTGNFEQRGILRNNEAMRREEQRRNTTDFEDTKGKNISSGNSQGNISQKTIEQEYSNVESEGGNNGEQIRRRSLLGSNNKLARIYENESLSKREYSRKEYENWERTLKPIEQTKLTSEQQETISNIKRQYNKDIVFFNGGENNLYSGGASYTNPNRINIDINKTRVFGENKMIFHEIAESDILHNKDLYNETLFPTIEKIISDPNFQEQKSIFWANENSSMPNDYLIAKDILCDVYSQSKTGESLDYKNVLSNETNMTINYALDNFYKQLNSRQNNARNGIKNQINNSVDNFSNINNNLSQNVFSEVLNNKNLPMQSYVYEKSDNLKIDNLRKDASKFFNNSNKAHDFINMLEKIITDKDIEIRLDANLITGDGRVANGSYSNGVITINPNSNKAGEFIAIHELTHAIGTKQMLDMVDNYRHLDTEFNESVKTLIENYKASELTEEALADVSGKLLGSQEFINNLSKKNPNLFKRIYNEIKYLWHQFRGYKNQNQFINDLQYKWEQAYRRNSKFNDTKKYLILENDKGKFVKADRQVIKGNNPLEWETQVEDYINNKIRNKQDVKVFTETGDILTITEDTSGKAKFRNQITDKYGNTRYLNNKEFLSKLTAESHIDELAQISKKINNKPVPDYKDHKFAKDGFDYRSAYFEDFDGQYYKITMSVGKNGDINTIYNIGKMDKKNRSNSSLMAQRPSNKFVTSNEESSSISSILPTKEDVNRNTTKYSMQESENNSGSFGLPTKNWNRYLEDNFTANGTRTNLSEIKLPTKEYFENRNTYILNEKNKIDKKVASMTGTSNEINQFVAEATVNSNISNINTDSTNDLINKYNQMEVLKNTYEKVARKENLSEKDRLQVERLLREEITIDELPKDVNKNGILNVYNTKRPYYNLKNYVDGYKKQLNSNRIDIANSLIKNIDSWKDKKLGWMYSRETARRNIYDIMPKADADKIYKTYFEPYSVHEAEATRDINRYNEMIDELDIGTSKKYKLGDNKVSESALVQMFGEGRISLDVLKGTGVNIEKIENAVKTFRGIYDELFEKLNKSSVENGYNPILKKKDYFPHFTETKPDSLISKIASKVGIDLTNQELPTDIAGITAQFKPGRKWMGNLLHRYSDITDFDALKGFDNYVRNATDIIYHTTDIKNLRALENAIRYNFSEDGFKDKINSIKDNTSLDDFEKAIQIQELFENKEVTHLSHFITWLNQYTNGLTGKKSMADRNWEYNLGRNIYSTMANLESRVSANMIAGNVSVALTNFGPLAQAKGEIKGINLLNGVWGTLKNTIKKDSSFSNSSDFISNRRGTDYLYQSGVNKFVEKITKPLNLVDDLVSESIVRAKYYENLQNGMSKEDALHNADEYTAGLMADRSKGQLPLIFNNKNPIAKLNTMFQVEVNNQWSYYFKDLPRNISEGKFQSAKLVGAYTKIAVGSFLFNELVNSIRGGDNRVLPDPINIILELVRGLGNDDDDWEIILDASKEIIGNLPFISFPAALLGVDDLGRIPVSGAVPNIGSVAQSTYGLLSGSMNGDKAKDNIGKELKKPLYYLLPPALGGQAKKSVEAIETIISGGSYGVDKDGNKVLQFPVQDLSVAQKIKAGIFGKYALPTAKTYSERGYKSLNAKQTKLYEETKLPYKQLLDYIDAGLTKSSDKIDYVNSNDLTTEQKWGIYKYNIFSNSIRADGGSQLSDAEYIVKSGVSKSDYINLYNKAVSKDVDMPTAEEYDKMKNSDLSLNRYVDYMCKLKDVTEKAKSNNKSVKESDKIQILLNSNYSTKDIKSIYENYICDKNDTSYNVIKTAGININEYLKYKQQSFTSDKVDDGTVGGKSVSGSKKKKVYEYVNSMDITYNQKLLLLGQQYKLTNDERSKLANYVNSMEISKNEKLEIFEKLQGFTVYTDGRVKW